jgi:hypothetical protein
MHGQLLRALDALAVWVREHNGKPFDKQTEAELTRLDTELRDLCQRVGVAIPTCEVPPNCHPLGFSGVPIHTSTRGMSVHFTLAWEQIIHEFRQVVEARRGKTWPAGWIKLSEMLPGVSWAQLPPEAAAQVQSKEPLSLTLGALQGLLASGGNLVPATLARCRELPTIRHHAAQLGLCPPGGFAASTVADIVDLLCVRRGVEQRDAYTLKLDAVAEFLAEEVAAPGKARGESAPTEGGAGLSSTRTDQSEEEANTEADPPLSERQLEVLEALHQLKAFDSNTRRTTDNVAVRVGGKDANPACFKEPIVELTSLGLVGTKQGRGGGCWLTAKGKERIERHKKR